MDIQRKTLSWLGNIRGKLDSFRSDIDDIINQVPFQYAENQLLKAGANVKQFCSEFVEEMLPEGIVNSLKERTLGELEEMLPEDIVNPLKEKTLGELLEKDANGGPTKGFSYDSSPFSMEIVDDAHTDSSLGTKTNLQKELCFKEIRSRETAFPSNVFHVEAHYQGGEYNGHDDLAHNLSSSTPSKEGEASDLNDTEISEHKKELSAVSQPMSNLQNQFLENEVSPLRHKVELSTVHGPSSSSNAEGEVSDPIDGCNKNQFLENQVSSLDHEVCKESIDLNDGSDDNKAEETEANQVAKADMDVIQSFRRGIGEDKFIMLDSSKLYLAPDLPEENHTSQGTLCELCLTMKFEKECECERKTSSKDGDVEYDQFEGKSLKGESVPLDQNFSESDWVIV